MREIEKWDYKYPGESPVTIRIGDRFDIVRKNGKIRSSWEITEITDKSRTHPLGIDCRLIKAKLLKGLYINEWEESIPIGRGAIWEFDDFIVAHRLRAEGRKSA